MGDLCGGGGGSRVRSLVVPVEGRHDHTKLTRTMQEGIVMKVAIVALLLLVIILIRAYGSSD